MVLRYMMTRTWMSVVCLLVAVPVAIRDVFDLGGRLSGETVTFRQGANIDLACRVVAYSALAALCVTLVVSTDMAKRRTLRARDLAVLLFLAACAFAVAIGLVLVDSATYVAHIRETGYAEVSHVPGIVAVPAVSLVFLLLRAFGAWNGVEPYGPRPRRRSNWTVPSPS